MNEWLRRILNAMSMGLIWAVSWAAVGVLIGRVEPSWLTGGLWLGPAIGMQPGFVAGLMFYAVLAIVGRRRLDEASLNQVVACGGLAGFFVGVLPFAINEPPSQAPLWLAAVVVIGSMILLSALSAAGSLAVVRRTRAQRR